MLRYLSIGSRKFGDTPMPPHARVNWEFLAVLRGRIAADVGANSPALHSSHLWLFPPGYVHGWKGDGRESAVAILHYSAVPPALDRLARGRGFLDISLSLSEQRAVERIARSVSRHYWKPTIASSIYCEQALLGLSVLLVRKLPEAKESAESGMNLTRVIDAEVWLRQRLQQGPSIADAAAHVGLSESQLRRLFLKVRSQTPLEALNEFRFERAMSLLAETDFKLQRVALECGFANASSFCRAFQHHCGFTPSVWRDEIYIQYKRPKPGEKENYAQHGVRKRVL
jgi:AraC-like DNA-binding protein